MFLGKDGSARNGPAIRRILVVEDEPLVAFDNENFLIHAGYTVVGTVDSYEAAAGLIESEQIDLVITDIKLSGDRDGVDVAGLAGTFQVPVLFVTGACPIAAHEIAYGCLEKPYSQKDLLTSIKIIDAIVSGTKRLPRAPTSLSVFRTPV